MEVTNILAVIDAEIAKLQQARALLAGAGTTTPKVRRGRPKGSKNANATASSSPTAKTATRKRQLSAEGRKAIADAMKKRWAERRKSAAKQAASK